VARVSDIAAAAAAMGVPETLVKRSAEARARATGATVDDILAAWAGGGEAPAAPASTSASEQEDARRQTPDASQELPDTPSEAGPAPDQGDARRQTPDARPQETPAVSVRRPAAPSAPPVLVGERQGVGVVISGSLSLLVVSLLLSVFLPSLQQPGNGIRSSNHPFSSAAIDGRDVYASQGCASCHTQLIRNVVTDVGLGPVSLDDTNQIIGYRRMGPDLSAVGSRIENTAALLALLAGEGDHPAAAGLSETDLANLVAYLQESR
jgi:mono/diheme cytochrome c family protein